MIKARSELNKDAGCVSCSIEIVKAFVNSNMQQAKPGHEQAVALLIGNKIVDTIAEAAKDYMELLKKS